MLNRLIIVLSIAIAMLSLPVMAGHGSKDTDKSHKGSKDSKGSHGSTDSVDDTQNCGVCDGKIDTLSLQYLGE